MKTYQLILATDLDGTFLEGDAQSKIFFYNELDRLSEDVLLIYTTGRPVDTVKEFCDEGYLPYPHFVLGDHGTHIVEGATFQPLEPLQSPIAEKWGASNQRLKELLQSESGLRLQPLDQPYRLAYYYDASRLQNQTLEKITQAGFDYILSSDLYLDILPQGVNKGTSLLNLIKHLGLSSDLVITAGDSLNDLPLFQTGLKSIAVANSEPKLIEKIEPMNNVYLSEHPGLLGIIDGLKFYEKFHLFSSSASATK